MALLGSIRAEIEASGWQQAAETPEGSGSFLQPSAAVYCHHGVLLCRVIKRGEMRDKMRGEFKRRQSPILGSGQGWTKLKMTWIGIGPYLITAGIWLMMATDCQDCPCYVM